MIRINLLPVREQIRRSAGRTQLFLFLGLLLAEMVIILLMASSAASELDDLTQKVERAKRDVKAAEQQVKDAKRLEKEKDLLEQQLKVLGQLEKNRTGPVRVLDEMQAILSQPRNADDRVAQLRNNWNVEWEPGRLWLGSLTEQNGSFELLGNAVSADDVAEFLQRLNTATHFYDIQLDYVKSSASGPRAGTPRFVAFRVTGKLTYNGERAKAAAPAGKGKSKKKRKKSRKGS